jgi:hypothetical protein
MKAAIGDTDAMAVRRLRVSNRTAANEIRRAGVQGGRGLGSERCISVPSPPSM